MPTIVASWVLPLGVRLRCSMPARRQQRFWAMLAPACLGASARGIPPLSGQQSLAGTWLQVLWDDAQASTIDHCPVPAALLAVW
jgi:hypothetical protein